MPRPGATVSDLGWQTHILTSLHIARLSWSHQLVWDDSFVCRASQVITRHLECKLPPQQTSPAGKDARWSAEPTISQPDAFTYVVLLASGTTWLHPALKKTSFRPRGKDERLQVWLIVSCGGRATLYKVATLKDSYTHLSHHLCLPFGFSEGVPLPFPSFGAV